MPRQSVTPFARAYGTYWARIPQFGRTGIARSLETTSKEKAERFCAFLFAMKNEREAVVLNALVDRTLTVGDAYDLWAVRGTEGVRTAIREKLATPTDVNIAPYIAKWQKELERIDSPQAITRGRYLQQVQSLVTEGEPFPASRFTDTVIRDHLAQYGKVSNKYRAALSSFGNYLWKVAKVIDHNPVLDVAAAKPSKPRTRYLSPEDCRRVIDALEGEMRAWWAITAATGMEQQAVRNLRRRHINVQERTVYCEATKNDHRSRTAFVYWRWEWAWEIFTAYLKEQALLPDAKVFRSGSWWARIHLRRACDHTHIAEFHPHDFRRTWGVQAAKDKVNIQAISRQLGHSNPAITYRVYADYIPTMDDFKRVSEGYVADSHTAPDQSQSSGGDK